MLARLGMSFPPIKKAEVSARQEKRLDAEWLKDPKWLVPWAAIRGKCIPWSKSRRLVRRPLLTQTPAAQPVTARPGSMIVAITTILVHGLLLCEVGADWCQSGKIG